MKATTVAQRSRKKGWRKPRRGVCVDRSSINKAGTEGWGNPFRVVGDHGAWWVEGRWSRFGPFATIRIARGVAVLHFEHWARTSDDTRARWIRANVHRLRGKVLLDWCPLDGPCHARPLARWADSGELAA